MSGAPWRTWRHLPEGHAAVALGSNLGDRRGQLEDAVERLGGHAGVEVLAASRLHRTAPEGGPPGQGEFLNGALLLRTSLTPELLLALLHRIEDLHGRERVVLDGPRTLDLDLLLHGEERRTGPELELPHPRMAERSFVLAPLAELCPELMLGGASVAERLADLGVVG